MLEKMSAARLNEAMLEAEAAGNWSRAARIEREFERRDEDANR